MNGYMNCLSVNKKGISERIVYGTVYAVWFMLYLLYELLCRVAVMIRYLYKVLRWPSSTFRAGTESLAE